MNRLYICIMICLFILASCSSPENSLLTEDSYLDAITTTCSDNDTDIDITISADIETTADTNLYIDTDIVAPDSVYLIEYTDQNIISVKLPVFNDFLIDELLTNYICGYLTKITLKEFNLTHSNDNIEMDTSEYSEYYINIDYKITYSSDQLISIVFQGLLNYKTAAHPIHMFFTLNIDREVKERLLFKDSYSINAEFYDTFSKYAKDSIIEKAGKWPENWGSFSESICSPEQFESGMICENEFFAYYTSNGIGISYPVPFALGNHFEVVIPYSEVEELAKTRDWSIS